MSFNTSSLLLFLVLVCICKAQDEYVKDTTNSSISDDANAGNSAAIQGLSDFVLDSNLTSIENKADSQTGRATSGNSISQSGGYAIKNSDLSFVLTAVDNDANSGNNDAVSGSQQVLNVALNSELSNSIQSYDNTAAVTAVGVDNSTNADAISGVQTSLTKNFKSNVTDDIIAVGNTATNLLGGAAISGISSSIKHTKNNGTITKDSYAAQNVATNVDGEAISGVQNNFQRVNNGSVYLESDTYNNVANSTSGDAVSGVQNNFFNFGELGNGGGDDPTVTPTLITNDTASDNTATATDGNAISGVQTNANKFRLSDVDIDAQATDNQATVQEGPATNPYNAVAGVDIDVNKVIDSNVTIQAVSNGNNAKNFDDSPDSDAIAGVDVFVGNIIGSSIVAVKADSRSNYAYSANGDAIAGNRVTLVGDASMGAVSANTVVGNNVAVAPNGVISKFSLIYVP